MFKPTLTLFVICAVVTAALAFTYVGTRDTIARRALLDAENARREVLAGADTFEPIKNLEKIAAGNVELNIVKEAFRGVKGDSMTGYVFSVDSKGYGGDIMITVGIDTEGKITGVKIGDNSETPGLGSRASDVVAPQFANLKPGGPLKVVKGTKSKPEEIDAISGATITSKAVVKGVQAAVDMASRLEKEEGISK